MKEKDLSLEAHRKLAAMMLTTIGANILCPEPLLSEKLEKLGVKNSIEFNMCNKELANITSGKEKAAVLMGLVISNLRQVEIQDLMFDLREEDSEILRYIIDHKECHEEVKPEDLARLLEG